MNDKTDQVDAICAALAAPFERKFVKFRPGATSGSRALAIPYVDARVIQDRLDEVLGSVNWQDEYEFLPDGSVMCRLRLRLGGEWITKMDVGGPSEQPDEGDRRKAAVSDALKRAAVKFGVGRYLYRLPQQWVDYDPQKKQLKNLPPLPEPAGNSTPAKRHPNTVPERRDDKGGGEIGHLSNPLPGWFTEVNGYLVKEGLAEDGEAETYLREKAKHEGPLAEVHPAQGGSLLADFGRKRIDFVADQQMERTGLTWEAAAEKAEIPAGLPPSACNNKQLMAVIKALRTLPAGKL